MSLKSVFDIAKVGWGLEDEDLDKIIKIENLKDVTQKFSDQTKTIVEKFGAVSHLRIIAFNEESGIDPYSKNVFASFIQGGGRDIIYDAILSNKECCVILIYSSKGEQMLKSYKHILCHEYAHHFQFTYAGFPYYIFKQRPPLPVPRFVEPYEVGPEIGSVFIDSSRLADLHTVIQDSNERISDVICEGLLRERDLTLDFLEYFKYDIVLRKDPATTIPQQLRMRFPNLKRYVRRLALRDAAEWGATIQLSYPKNSNAIKAISQSRKVAIKLNKKLPNVSQVYDRIYKLCVSTDFHLFKSPQKTMDYTKKVMDLLNIRVKTSEKW